MKTCVYLLCIIGMFSICTATFPTTFFSDGFEDGVVAQEKWDIISENITESAGRLRLPFPTHSPWESAIITDDKSFSDFVLWTQWQLKGIGTMSGERNVEIRFRCSLAGVGYSLTFAINDPTPNIRLRRSDTWEQIGSCCQANSFSLNDTYTVRITAQGDSIHVLVWRKRYYQSTPQLILNWSGTDTSFHSGGIRLSNFQTGPIEFEFISLTPLPLFKEDDFYALDQGAFYNGMVLFTETVANNYNDLGAQWQRLEFIHTGGTIDYTKFDEIVNRALTHNIRLLGLVDYQTYPWSDTSDWSTPEYRTNFVNRVAEIVTRYKDSIKAWEIWNEENSPYYVTPEAYGQMIADCYDTIKAISPDALVVFGGLASTWSQSGDYLNSVYSSTAFTNYYATHQRYPFDVLAVHPYHWTGNPYDYLQHNLQTNIRSVLNAHNDAHKRIWLTEIGWNTSRTSPTGLGDNDNNEEIQAQYLENLYDLCYGLVDFNYPEMGPYIEQVFYFCYSDFVIPGQEEFFGLIRLDGTSKKPSYYRYKSLTHKNDELFLSRNLVTPATIISSCGQDSEEFAVDRICDHSPFTYWKHSGDEEHFVTIDLGQEFTITSIVLKYAELGGLSADKNVKSLVIENGTSDSGPWSTLFSLTNSEKEPLNVFTFEPPQSIRYLRVRFPEANYVSGNEITLPELEIWGTTTVIPEPTPTPSPTPTPVPTSTPIPLPSLLLFF